MPFLMVNDPDKRQTIGSHKNAGARMNTSAGLSLMGLMDETWAIPYLRRQCAFQGDQSDARLAYEWRTARDRIGSPMGRMGMPSVKDIPEAMRSYVEELKRQDWLTHRLNGHLAGAEFKMVEVDPLMAMQFAIDVDRSTHLCTAFSGSRTDEDLFSVCLPMNPPEPEVNLFKDHTGSGSMLISTKNLSFGIHKEGAHEIQTDNGPRFLIGIEVTTPLPLLHVVRYQDRYYLHNGFHRAYSARQAGATHVPCILRTVTHEGDIGIGTDTFGMDHFRSPNPPTVGHYTAGRAHTVRLKSLTRMIQVNWSEYTV